MKTIFTILPLSLLIVIGAGCSSVAEEPSVQRTMPFSCSDYGWIETEDGDCIIPSEEPDFEDEDRDPLDYYRGY